MTSAITRSFKQLSTFYKVPSRIYCFSRTEMNRPVERAITNKLQSELNPSYLDVINESYMHNVPKDSESHFKVVVVSRKFEKLPLIQRHRLINEILENELAKSIHALSIQAKTPEQWEASGGTVNKSPPCLGGSGR
ncbi:bolA-like protein DDB_G0274169 [Dendronephthya gigantea]|uniref:bolA-like protein DDB_G0274169 n=1 Tax=Dendronephthya gigantea TaxID=151771 RepID=UPI00106DBA00|nr:bolA-like protein DDB_G0274169 [Dendronephthya gigantea]